MNKNIWHYKPGSSNEYFYTLAIETCIIAPLLIFGTFNMFFPRTNNMVRMSFWGMAVALALHIYRLYSYRCSPRRTKTAFPMIFFVFVCFCTVLYFDKWNLGNIFMNRGLMLCYVVSTPLFIFWSRLKNHDDRLTILLFLGINWFLSVCFVLPALHCILMFASALTAYGAMALLQKRVKDGIYWRNPVGTEGYERDHSGLLCTQVVVLLVWVGLGIFIAVDKQHNHQFFRPAGTAFHFAVSLYLASEYVLYTLNKCGLLELADGKK